MILPKERDPRLTTVRRGGSLTDEDHHLLAEYAAQCAEHVLPLFESARPDDPRPREAIALGRAWVRGEVPMRQAHRTAFVANAAGRGVPDGPRFAALAAGQAVAVAHVAAHYLGAAAYALRAVMAVAGDLTDGGTADGGTATEAARLEELAWQHGRIPGPLRDFVLEDERARNAICWGVFAG